MAKHDCDYRVEAEDLRAQLTTVQARLDALERQLAEQKKKAIGRTSEGSKRAPENRPAPRPKNDAAAQEERAKKRAVRDTLPQVAVKHEVLDEEKLCCSECGQNCFVEVAPDTSTELRVGAGPPHTQAPHARDTALHQLQSLRSRAGSTACR